jgi:DNA-nicking Smr family endonuclease
MPKLEQRVLKHDVIQAEKQLTKLAITHGKTSPEYQNALKRFIRLWSVLRMTRSQDEFFHEVSNIPAQR